MESASLPNKQEADNQHRKIGKYRSERNEDQGRLHTWQECYNAQISAVLVSKRGVTPEKKKKQE
jgi:hypothetical protein